MRRLTPDERARLHRFFWPSEDDDLEALVAVLQTPEELHQLAWSFNWDDVGLEAPRAIIRRPDCDLGTAVLLYWHSGPRFYAQYPGEQEVPAHSRALYALHREIEERVRTGFYAHRAFRFDPRDDRGHDWTHDYADLPERTPLPAEMRQATPGDPAEREQVS